MGDAISWATPTPLWSLLYSTIVLHDYNLTLICFQGKKQECVFGGKCSYSIVAIQESCLDSRHFYTSFPAPIEVSSNVKDLVSSL